MSYFIQYKDVFYYLDATSDIATRKTAKLTSNPTMDRKSRSDNYITDNPTVRYSGVITDILTPSSLKQMSTSEYLDALSLAMDNQSEVLLKHRLDLPAEDSWFITSFTYSQDNTNGYGGVSLTGDIVQSFKISISLERAQFTSAVKVSFKVPPALKPDLQEQTTTNGTSQDKKDVKPDELPSSIKSLQDAAKAQENAAFYMNRGQYSVVRQAVADANEE